MKANKLNIAMLATAFSIVVFAQAVRETPMTPEKRAQLLERAGGHIMPPDNGKRVLLADFRGEGAPDFTRVFLDHQEHMFAFPVTKLCKEPPAENVSAYALAKGMQSEEFPVVVAIVDNASMPGLAAYPEEALAVVNVAKYRCDDEGRFSRRITRELWRAFGFAMGAYADQPQGDVLQAVFSNERLDKVRSPILSPMRSGGVIRAAHELGLRPMQPTTYEVACQEGWAPPPTNDLQRAVWNRLNAEKERGPAVQRPIRRQGQPPRPPRKAK